SLAALKQPISIEALSDGTVLILDQLPDPNAKSSVIHRFRFDTEVGAPVSLDIMKSRFEGAPADFTLFGHDLAVAGGRVYGAPTGMSPPAQPAGKPSGGEQAYAFNLTLSDTSFSLDPLPDYIPMRFFGAKGVVASGDDVFYDYADGWVNLVKQPRARYRAAS